MVDVLQQLIQPRNYLPKCLKIRTKSGTLEPFVINDAQDVVLKVVEDLEERNKPIRIIILKARQMGISTLTEGLIFNRTATKSLVSSMIVAHEDKASQNLYRMYKTYYENLPPVLTPMTKYSNSQELLFENPTNDINDKRENPGLRSRVTVVTANNVKSGRSDTIHNLHASEVAFWEDAETLMTGLMQTIPELPNTMVIIESTANGVGGYFYNMWKAAEKGENDFIPIFLPWFTDKSYTRPFETEEQIQAFIEQVNYVAHDNNGNEVHTEEWHLREAHNLTYEQLNWRKHIIANKLHGDVELFYQEYPSTPDEAFITSGRPRFPMGILKEYLNKCSEGERGYLEERNGQIVWVPDGNGYIEMWRKPEADRFYCIGADVAEGLATGDYSCGVVGSDDFDIHAMWHGHIDPDLFGLELVKLARYYNEAYVGCERNNHGLTTLKAMQNKEYWNIYFQKIYDKITETITQKIGWGTDRRTKPLMINKLAEFVREKWLGIKSKLFVGELMTYIIEDDGTTNAQEGCHDDTVMAVAILLQLLLEGKGENYTPENTEKEPVKKDWHRDEDIDEDSEQRLEIAE